MRRSWRATLTTVALTALLATSLAGCAAPGGTSSLRTQANVTPTATPRPTPTASDSHCDLPASAPRVGDLLLGAPTVLYGFNADYMLPDGLPLKPLAITLQDSEAYVSGSRLEGRPVVGTSAAFVVEFCNTSASRAYRLTGFGAKIVTLASYTGSLGALNGCAYLYGKPTGVGGECASGFSPDAIVSFRFANAVPQASDIQAPGSAIALAPGQQLTVSYAVQAPASNVLATYQLGFAMDGQTVSYPVALVTQAVVSAPIAHRWAGDYCSTPQMQAQIPTTIPANTYYACPQQ